jgi:adenylyl cyclase-associated protein
VWFAVQVFLSEEAAQTSEVVTSKCSALTVTVLPQEAENDPVEHPVPEQFVSKVVDGKLVTTPVVHM